MGCGCNTKKTEYTVTFSDGSKPLVTFNSQEARSAARIKGGSVTTRQVKKE